MAKYQLIVPEHFLGAKNNILDHQELGTDAQHKPVFTQSKNIKHGNSSSK
jgi:hypothetical protein